MGSVRRLFCLCAALLAAWGSPTASAQSELPKLPDTISAPPLVEVKLPTLPQVPGLPNLQGTSPSSSSSAPPSSPSAARPAPSAARTISSRTRARPVATGGRTASRPAAAGTAGSRPPSRGSAVRTTQTPAGRAGTAPRRPPASGGIRPSRSPVIASESRGADDPLGALGRILPLPVPDWSKPIILGLLLLAAALAVRSRVATVRARRLEAQRTELVEDLGAVQGALVPAVPPHLGGLAVSVAYRPAEGPAAGGDFYDAFPVGDAAVGLVLGDASGHGREALARSALMRYTLRAYVEAGLEPRAALELAGQVLPQSSGEEFTTVAVAVYDSGAGTLTYAMAGHPPPILVGPTAHEPVTVCASPAIGWGVPTGRRQTTVSLPAGALVCLFSDGLTEARSRGRMLEREGLESLLRGLGPGVSAPELLRAVRARADDAPDDMAACIIASDPPRTASALRVEELELSAQQLDGGHAQRFLSACHAPADEAAAAAALARRIAAECGAAVLNARVQPGPTQVSVRPRRRSGATGDESSPETPQALAPA